MTIEHLDCFRRVAEEIAVDLELDKGSIKVRHTESRLGFDYTATLLNDSRGFDFHLGKDVEDRKTKRGEMRASLTIYFQEGVAPYFFNENIDYIVDHPDFLSRWASWAIFNFRQVHEKANLQSLFHDVDIRAYGLSGYNNPTDGEAEIFFNGLLTTQRDKILIYEFRHMSRESFLCRSISYAVCATSKDFHTFWVVFPDCCGLDSGGAYSSYRLFAGLIEKLKSRFQVEVRRYDLKYNELETFLLKKSVDFLLSFRNIDLEMLLHYFGPPTVLATSEPQFQSFMERLEKREYPEALRDLRALVQQAEENVAKFKKLDYSNVKDTDINRLAAFLIEKKLIDGRLRPWFQAFTSAANPASHGDFPTKSDMENAVMRTRVFLAFHLGVYLIDELDEIVRPKIPIFKVPIFSKLKTKRKKA